eukprot:365560-Chlamydomonas_euryale.AAC.1
MAGLGEGVTRGGSGGVPARCSHLAGARRVRVLAALEAEHCAATALRLHKRVAVDLHRSAAPRHARADAHACVVLDVGEQHRLLEAAQVAPRRATQQLLHLVEVAHRAALVRHAPARRGRAVSYTHLTLPTILLV